MLNLCTTILNYPGSGSWTGPSCPTYAPGEERKILANERKGCCLMYVPLTCDEYTVGTLFFTKDGKIFHETAGYRDPGGFMVPYNGTYITSRPTDGYDKVKAIQVSNNQCLGFEMPGIYNWMYWDWTNVSEQDVIKRRDEAYDDVLKSSYVTEYAKKYCIGNRIFTDPSICRDDYSYFGIFGEPEGSWAIMSNWLIDIPGLGVYNNTISPYYEFYNDIRYPENHTESSRLRLYNYLLSNNKLYALSFYIGGRRTIAFDLKKQQKNKMWWIQYKSNDRSVGGQGYGRFVIWSREQLKYSFIN